MESKNVFRIPPFPFARGGAAAATVTTTKTSATGGGDGGGTSARDSTHHFNDMQDFVLPAPPTFHTIPHTAPPDLMSMEQDHGHISYDDATTNFDTFPHDSSAQYHEEEQQDDDDRQVSQGSQNDSNPRHDMPSMMMGETDVEYHKENGGGGMINKHLDSNHNQVDHDENHHPSMSHMVRGDSSEEQQGGGSNDDDEYGGQDDDDVHLLQGDAMLMMEQVNQILEDSLQEYTTTVKKTMRELVHYQKQSLIVTKRYWHPVLHNERHEAIRLDSVQSNVEHVTQQMSGVLGDTEPWMTVMQPMPPVSPSSPPFAGAP